MWANNENSVLCRARGWEDKIEKDVVVVLAGLNREPTGRRFFAGLRPMTHVRCGIRKFHSGHAS